MNKVKLLDHLWDMHDYHQGEAEKFEKGGVEESRKHYQTVADVYFKLYQEVGAGDFDET
ncbi:hypothetical protein ACWF7H_19940 [Peribacillus butanolivorans]|uniref:hypothetical protein n=1 Tax=Peribacillus butanolivorans TaxID=421767 RepID=UPI0036CA9EB3